MITKPGINRGSALNALDEGMVPAINIVFLLLIFFMIAGQIGGLQIRVPVPQAEHMPSLSETDIVLHVDAEGQYQLQGTPIRGDLEDALVAIDGLSSQSLVVVVNRDLPAAVLDPVLRALRTLPLNRLLIATESST